MATIVEMPKLSDTMEEGGVSKWLKKEGESFKEGDPLLEIETDKATMEYASPVSGCLLKILVAEKTTVSLKTPLAVVGKAGESFDLSVLVKPSTAVKTPTSSHPEVAPEAAGPRQRETPKPSQGISQSPGNSSGRIKASPFAKKLAKEKGLSLDNIQGTGPQGRIVAKDIQQSSGTRASIATSHASTSQEALKIPHTMMRKTIAKRLLSAKNDAPHFYLTTSVNMETADRWRNELNPPQATAKVSLNDIVLLAVAKALTKHPEVNSSWTDDGILQFPFVHISMAVALPTGLITPVIRHVDKLGIRVLAQQTRHLGEIAKRGELKPEDYHGGTFTVSNLGMTCVEEFTAIINPPQSCILAVGRMEKVPHVTEDDRIVIQKRMKMTLSCDHRVVDGMVGAQFLGTLKRYLENPLLMLE